MKNRYGAAIVLTVVLLSLAAVACASAPASPGPAGPVTIVEPQISDPLSPDVGTATGTAAETPVLPQPDRVEVLAPIDGVDSNIAESFPPQYFVHVKSGLPDACYTFNSYDVSRDEDTVRIAVTNLKPSGPAICAEVYGTVESNIALGTDFEGGKTYTVIVNDVSETFIAQ